MVNSSVSGYERCFDLLNNTRIPCLLLFVFAAFNSSLLVNIYPRFIYVFPHSANIMKVSMYVSLD